MAGRRGTPGRAPGAVGGAGRCADHRGPPGLARRRGALVLEVSDDGQGFDASAVTATEHYGLRGLESLVHDTGGSLALRVLDHHPEPQTLEIRRLLAHQAVS